MLKIIGTILTALIIGMSTSVTYGQTPPQWWVDHNVTNSNVKLDEGLVSVGQVKYVVKQAYAYLELELEAFGGSGSAVTNLYTTFCTTAPANLEDDLRVITLGQLKFLAKPFYDRIMEVQFDPSTMNPESGNYPWSDTQDDDQDDAPATLGQLKFVFSFDLSRSLDADEIPDWWEANYNIDPLKNIDNTATDFDGDAILDFAEYLGKSDPTDYFNGAVPALRLLSGDGQSVASGESATAPLILVAEDIASNPLSNAPISVSLLPGESGTVTDSIQATSNAVSVRTNVSGQTEISFHASANYTGDVTIRFLAESASNQVYLDATLTVLDAISNWLLFAGPQQTALSDRSTFAVSGRNESGQLTGEVSETLTIFSGLTTLPADIVKIDFGSDHAIALTAAGDVYTWGDNFFGQLGLGDNDARLSPTQIVFSHSVLDVSAGDGYSLLVVSDGLGGTDLFACGNLSDGLSSSLQLVNTPISLGFDMVSPVHVVDASAKHALFICEDGSVWSWGDNRHGEVNPTSMALKLSDPVQIIAGGAAQINAAPDVSLVLMDNGELLGWGNTSFGQLGNVTTISDGIISLANNVAHFTGGNGFVAYVTESNQLLTAGLNESKQLGRDTGIAALSVFDLVSLPSNDTIRSISAGDRHLVYSTNQLGAKVFGFGDNRQGALGQVPASLVATPTELSPNF